MITIKNESRNKLFLKKKNELKSLMKPAKLGKTMTKRSKSLKEDEMKKIKTLTGRQVYYLLRNY